MSIIVSVKIHDGIVLAADSATTFFFKDGSPGQIYEHVNKIVNVVKGAPVGVMTCGAGGVGNASIATLLKDFRCRLASDDERWRLDRNTYTISEISTRLRDFFCERANEVQFKGQLMLRVCGYSASRPLPEVWQVLLNDCDCPDPTAVQVENDIGPLWNGESEALDRILLGTGSHISSALAEALGLNSEQAAEAATKLLPKLYQALILPAAPVQDAIDLARFMVETTKGFIRFSINKVKTVDGLVEIAAITKHEGFKWVQRKHFYSPSLNSP